MSLNIQLYKIFPSLLLRIESKLLVCRKDKERVLDAIRSRHIDAADMSFPNLIDSIVMTMIHHSFLDPISDFLVGQRRDNSHIPFGILMILTIVATMKLKTSLTDVPFAVK